MISRYEQFTTTISSIYHYFQRIEREEMERYGLRGTFTQYLLAIERSRDGITAAQLSELCEKDKAAVSRAVAEMEAQGLIERCMPNERGYRAKLYITQEGRRAAEFVRRRSRLAVDLAGRGVNDEDRAAMYLALECIAANLHRLSRDGLPQDGVDY